MNPTFSLLVMAAPSCTSRIAPFVPESSTFNDDEAAAPGTNVSITVPDFTTIFAGVVLFEPPTVHVELALCALFATSHVPAQM